MLGRRNGNGHRERNLASLIDLYLLRCEVEGKSPNTLKAYTWALRRFVEIAREEGLPEDVAQITAAHIYSYLGRFAHLSLETRHRYHREVSCFFGWLHRQVRPMPAAMTARYGGGVKYVEGFMKEGKPRRKTKHHLLADGKL